jgi:hypothetical protein
MKDYPGVQLPILFPPVPKKSESAYFFQDVLEAAGHCYTQFSENLGLTKGKSLSKKTL